MTRELLVGSLKGERFGAWRAGVRETIPVRGVSRLSAGRGGLVVAVLDGKMTILRDVAASLGLEEAPWSREGTVIPAASGEEVAGYFFGGDLSPVEVADEQVLPLPAWAQTGAIRSCALIGGAVVPILELESLSGGGGEEEKPRGLAPERSTPREIRVVMVRGAPIAVGGDSVEIAAPGDRVVRSLPHAPPGVAGLVAAGDRLVVLPRLAGGAEAGAGSRLVVAEIRGESYGIGADAFGGALQAAACRLEPMPPLLAQPWLSSCVAADDALIPLLDLRLLAACEGRKDAPSLPAWEPGSDFAGRFLREEVEVLEIEQGDAVYALPGNEVTDLPELPPVARILGPDSAPARGITLYEGAALPALGSGSAEGLLVTNGSFACILVGARARGRRMVALGLQRSLPLPSPGGTVYGCYVDGGGVTLVLNVAAVVMKGEDARLHGARPTAAPPEMHASRWTAWRPAAETERKAEPPAGTEREPELRPEPPPPGEPDSSPELSPSPSEAVTAATAESAGEPLAVPAPLPEAEASRPAELVVEEVFFNVRSLEEAPEAPRDTEGIAAKPAAPRDEQTRAGPVVVEEAPFGGMSLEEAPDLVPSYEATGSAPSPTGAARAAPVEPRPVIRTRRHARPWWLLLPAAAILAVAAIALPRLAAGRPAPPPGQGTPAGAPAAQLPSPTEPAVPAAPATGEPNATPPSDTAAVAAEPAAASEPEATLLPPTPAAEPETPAAFEREIVVYFAANSAVIDPSAARILEEAASAIAASSGKPVEVTITGHTALAETRELRLALSLRRAEVARDYLAARLPAGSMTVRCEGRGAEEPAAPNDTKESMSLNRRTVISLTSR